MSTIALSEKYNTPETLLGTLNLQLYTNTDPNLGKTILQQALHERFKTEPDFEVWLPLKYWAYARSKDRMSATYYEVPHVFISNRGRVLNTSQEDAEPHDGTDDGDGYKVFSVTLGEDEGQRTFMVGRAVACCFLPVPDSLINHKIIDLEVGYYDDDRSNNNVGNLEWKLVKDITEQA